MPDRKIAERRKTGMLSDKDIEGLIREAAFGPVAGAARFEQIGPADLRLDYRNQLECVTFPATSATEEEFVRLELMRERFVGTDAKIELVTHRCSARNRDPVERNAIRIERTFLGRNLSRELMAS